MQATIKNLHKYKKLQNRFDFFINLCYNEMIEMIFRKEAYIQWVKL